MLAAIYKKGPEIQIKVEACLVWFHAKKKKKQTWECLFLK